MKFYNFLWNQKSPVIVDEWELENFESLTREDLNLLEQDKRNKQSSPFFILLLIVVSALAAIMIYLSF
jgi:hypothetical protein